MSLRLFAFSVVSLLFISHPSFGKNQQLDQSINKLSSLDNGQLFTIKGSNTVGAKLAPTWAKSYLEYIGVNDVQILPGSQENEYIVEGINHGQPTFISIEAHGSSTGFLGLADQSATLAMSSRPIKARENHTIDQHIDLTNFRSEHVVAIDGLAIIVHPSNPIDSLTKSQVARIFSGQYTNWRQLGGRDLPIKRYARDDKSGTWDTFKNIVLAKKYRLAPETARFESNDRLSEAVARDFHSIGFVGLASVLDAKPLAIADEETKAIQPESLYVATEDYPLSRRLFMYSVPERTNRYSDDFLKFIQSEHGQSIVENVGFVSQKPISLAIKDIEGIDEYVNIVKHGERLSVNFRFNAGSSKIDNKALHDVERLAKFMQEDDNKDKLVQLIGFGDTESTSQRAVVLSKLRALAVKSALRKYGIHSESITGFGDISPVASLSGNFAHKNQRVEVWVYEPEKKAVLNVAKRKAASKARETYATTIEP